MADANRSGKRFNIVLSILIAVLLWFYVVNVENPSGQTTLSGVPVQIVGAQTLEKNGLLVTELSRDTVNIKAVGKRKTFLKLYNLDVSLNVDVSGIDEPGEYRLIGRVAPESIRNDGSVSLSERDSFVITVTVKKKASKEIPVIGEFHGTIANGFAADPIQLNPGTIEVSGPEELIERVSHAVVVLSAEGVKESITQDASFVILDQQGTVMQEENLRSTQKTVRLTLPVVKLYEIPLTVSLKDGGGASSADTSVTISPTSVKLSGSEALLGGLKEIKLGEIDLADIPDGKTLSFPIPIPEGAKVHSEEQTATVSIGVKLPTKSISATQISLINVPKGYQATLLTNAVEVSVRGTKEQLDRLANENIRIVADLSAAERRKGQQSLAVKVYLDGLDGLGVVGTDYRIDVRLR